MIRRAIGLLLAIAVVALTVAGSHVRLGAFPAASAMVRVSWSARPERVETCRRLSDEEYAGRPTHMRRRVECEGTTARYELRVLRDSVLLAVDTVRGGGLRHDRELYVYRELAVPPGRARIAVRFVRLDSSLAADELLRADTSAEAALGGAAIGDRAAREDEERQRRRAEAVAPLLELDTVIALAPRGAVLVTYGDVTRRLTLRAGLP
ncbi:MAG: hypothetical protein U9Q74_03370 [Gemmatimonadota bacterium]|nr:hypothetical protein [Gemmatimonadota bacterium]